MSEWWIYFKIYENDHRQTPNIEAEIKIKKPDEFKKKLSKIIEEHSITFENPSSKEEKQP